MLNETKSSENSSLVREYTEREVPNDNTYDSQQYSTPTDREGAAAVLSVIPPS